MPERQIAKELERRADDLRKSLEEDRAHLQEIRRRVELQEQMLRAIELLLQVEHGLPVKPTQTAAAAPAVTEPAKQPTITEAVTSVLVEHGHPMHADEIMERLRSRGIELSEKDPKATVVTALVRGTKKGLFVRTEPNTFRIARPGEGGGA